MGDAGENGVPKEPIAVIGMACRLPGHVASPSKLWERLAAGYSGWSEIPKSRFDTASFFHPDPNRKGHFHVRGGHFLTEDVTCFDAPFFSISATEAEAIDPQQRLLLEIVYESLENGGIPLNHVSGKDVGVFVSSAQTEYRAHTSRDINTAPKLDGIGTDLALLSNRVSLLIQLDRFTLCLSKPETRRELHCY
ncbi:MAG: hypothetical protein Q9227_000789, partial [Pyrenula ochraceoflavens]